jgi:hypothetical protein
MAVHSYDLRDLWLLNIQLIYHLNTYREIKYSPSPLESTLLQVTLPFPRSSKVNSCDNNIEYSTSKIVKITSSNINSCESQGYGTLC